MLDEDEMYNLYISLCASSL